MRGILKNTLLFTGGVMLGSLVTQRALLRAVKSKDHICRQDEVLFETREDAEHVLADLRTLIDTYAHATVADFYELANINDFKYKMTKLGWTSVDSADGYAVKLPKPLPITYKEEG